MPQPSRPRRPNARPATESKSGPRPIARIPGEGRLLPSRRNEAGGRSVRRGLSERTREVYRRDWHRFASWCKANRVNELPCRPETLIRYLDHRAAHAPRSVLNRELIVICRTHRAEGERSPRQFPLVRKWLRNYQDDPGLARPAAPPIQATHLRAMISRLHELAQTDETAGGPARRRLVALRDRALILIGKSAHLRRLDFRKLTRADVNVVTGGLELTLRRSRALGGTTKIVLHRVRPPLLCPVDAWQAWIGAVDGDATDPAFPLLGTNGPRDKPVGPTDICISIKRAIHAVGIDPTPYTDDSLAAV